MGLPAPDPEALRCQVARLGALQSVRDTWRAWLENRQPYWQPEDPLAFFQDSMFPIFRAALEKASQESLLEDGCKALGCSRNCFLCVIVAACLDMSSCHRVWQEDIHIVLHFPHFMSCSRAPCLRRPS